VNHDPVRGVPALDVGRQKSTDWNFGVDVDVKGVGVGGGGSHGTSSETGRALPPPSGSQSFIAKLNVVGIEVREPTGTVEIGHVRAFVNKTFDVDFKRRDNAVLPGDQRDKLLDWYFGLSQLTRKRLKLGKQALELEAFASQTQPADKNQHLAERRQAAVIGVLGRFVAPENWPKHATAYGEDLLREDRPGKEEEDPSMWSVRLKVVDEITPADEAADLDGFDELMPE
jgi:hypothetical protein